MTAQQAIVLAVGVGIDLVLVALPLFAWWLRGRDPQYTDDDSVLMPSPPPDFTPALATIVMKGRPSRRTVSAGLMYLVSQNLITFETEPSPVGIRAGIRLTAHRPKRLQLPEPEKALYVAIRELIDRIGQIQSEELEALNSAVTDFCQALDKIAWERGWVHSRTGNLIHRWRTVAAIELIVGLGSGYVSMLLPPSLEVALALGITSVGLVAAAAVTFLASRAMPARTKDGAQLAAMLNAYRRTLAATISSAHSLEEIVVMAPLPWVGTPEEEVAWAVAFDLDRQIGRLVNESLEWGWVGGWPKSIWEWLSTW